MTYGEQVLARATSPGALLLLVGVVVAVLPGLLTRGMAEERREKIGLVAKAAGCVIAVVGALLLFL